MKVIPYLGFRGNAEEALNFYAEVFDGKITFLQHYDQSPMEVDEGYSHKVVHATFVFGENTLMASDMKDQPETPYSNVQLSVSMDSEEQIDRVFTAMSEGGAVILPLEKQYWGAKFGMIRDKFGILWMFNYDEK